MTEQEQLKELEAKASERNGLKVPGTDGQPEVYGCTDTLAINYDILATKDNGTCRYLAAD